MVGALFAWGLYDMHGNANRRIGDLEVGSAIGQAEPVIIHRLQKHVARPRQADRTVEATGKTTITSSYAGRQIVQQVEVADSEPPLACTATTRPVVVDGELSELARSRQRLGRRHLRAATGPAIGVCNSQSQAVQRTGLAVFNAFDIPIAPLLCLTSVF